MQREPELAAVYGARNASELMVASDAARRPAVVTARPMPSKNMRRRMRHEGEAGTINRQILYLYTVSMAVYRLGIT